MKTLEEMYRAALLRSFNAIFKGYAFNRGLHYRDALQVCGSLLDSRFYSRVLDAPPEARQAMDSIAITAAAGFDPRFMLSPRRAANTN